MEVEARPKDYPKLTEYAPSKFMLTTSHYDKAKSDRTVAFIENHCHTKGKWAGKRFWLLPWQEKLIRDVFSTVKANRTRQFRTAFVEIPKKKGKSELAAAVALYMLYADNEPSAEIYGAASDRQQASIVFDVTKKMVELSPALMRQSKIMAAQKRLVNYSNAEFYQELLADVGNKHGLNIFCVVIDELNSLPNRDLYDVLTKGSSDARENPLHFIITTAGNDRNSICYELHLKAVDVLSDRIIDPAFYPVVFGLPDDGDWENEENWYNANPSLENTITIDRMRNAFRDAKNNLVDKVTFCWLQLNQWVSSTVAWIPDAVFMLGDKPINMDALKGRQCHVGLDLSTSEDITALMLIFPPRTGDEKYIIVPFFQIPEENIAKKFRKTGVSYDVWRAKGLLTATPSNVIDYAYIHNKIGELSEEYHILEIAFDLWGFNMLVERLTEMGLAVVTFGQGYKDMSSSSRAFYENIMKGNVIRAGNPILRWMAGNVVIETDSAGNIKPTKAKSKGKIDGIVAAIMALDRCIRNECQQQGSIYDERDMFVI